MEGESCPISKSLQSQSSWDLPAPPARIKVQTPQAGQQSAADRFTAELEQTFSSSSVSSAQAVTSITHYIDSLEQPLPKCPPTPHSGTSSTRSDSSTDCWIAAVIPKYGCNSPNSSSSSARGACNQNNSSSCSKAPAAWQDPGSCAEVAPQDAHAPLAGRAGGSLQAVPLVDTPMQVSILVAFDNISVEPVK
jgi:hypothetical protein